MTYGVPWAEFTAALALVDQDNNISVSFTSRFVVLEGAEQSRDRMRALLHGFKIRKYLEVGETRRIISIPIHRFDGLPEG